jgi:hypothetical protein
MSIDFAALTQAVVAGLSDVRSCLMVSRDGLALGASPATEEGRTLEVWTRIAALGDVERGFVTIRDEVWVFCRRGAYGALATAPSTARPGIILDSLEQIVLALLRSAKPRWLITLTGGAPCPTGIARVLSSRLSNAFPPRLKRWPFPHGPSDSWRKRTSDGQRKTRGQ